MPAEPCCHPRIRVLSSCRDRDAGCSIRQEGESSGMIAPCAAILMLLSVQPEPFPEAVQTIDPDPAWIDPKPLEHAGQVAMCEPFHVSHLPGELNWHIGMVLLGDPSLVPSLHLTGIGQGGDGPAFTDRWCRIRRTGRPASSSPRPSQPMSRFRCSTCPEASSSRRTWRSISRAGTRCSSGRSAPVSDSCICAQGSSTRLRDSSYWSNCRRRRRGEGRP